MAMVIFDNFKSAEQTSLTIKELRESLGVKPEFKFNKSSYEQRDMFFRAIAQHNFSIQALVVDKKIIRSQQLKQRKDSFYNFFIRNLLAYDNKVLINATVKIDGSGNKELQNAMLGYLRKQIGSGKVNKYKIVDSKKDNLIQLADMAVGAIARAYSAKRKDSDRWLNMLQNKEN